jgi:streptogramin lyase
MSANRTIPAPAPRPFCAAYTSLLPLLHANELDADQTTAVREHVVDCAWCRSVLATYDVVDDALRRHFGPGPAAPIGLTMEAIMSATSQEDSISPSDEDDELTMTSLRQTPVGLPHQRRFFSGLAALAAVLLIALLAQALFALFRSPTASRPPTPKPPIHSGRFIEYPLPMSISAPGGLVVGPDGNLWFTEYGGNAIGRISPKGVLKEFRLPSANSDPSGITTGPDGNLWFVESYYGSKIGRITPTGTITEFSVPSATTNNSGLTGITTGPDGNLWFVESYSDGMGRITPRGVITEFRLVPGTGPFGIAAGPDGNLWFTESNGNRIGRITPQGAITEFPLPQLGSGLDSITRGPDGNLWFTEAFGNRIGRFSP